ncbi:MAG: lipocalin-like domain-containing protein [Gammaproteobacteria bacterium]|nr:MAG: lipocalin-like domain-containing protein [Gammaproteobacteria bacterium]TLZ10799.1 MAG: lipocalin-like domain-containing protein [Gammaproteobacteria bacterium]TLZ12188.1 MAG: lipocalin-like domain-containing protein [Gammaproteobacteria bacterium]TLZ21112.1 MAG: lipocalin-like domain-containing protein [Gammaproteobacteria bacterium]TLZ24222.1 MAG: lipocalin-like domain-containing protein [Gammaproteobacteria bacterium]
MAACTLRSRARSSAGTSARTAASTRRAPRSTTRRGSSAAWRGRCGSSRVRESTSLKHRGRGDVAVKRSVLLIILPLFALLCPVSAQTDRTGSAHPDLVGTWRLVSYVGEEVPSGVRSDVMGAHPGGYINYGRDGRMIVIIVGSERKRPAGPVATPEEAAALMRSMLAYAGTYTVDAAAKTVTHHVDVSWDETRTGQSLMRTYRLNGDRLTLLTDPSNDPATGRKTVRTVTWERLKAPQD